MLISLISVYRIGTHLPGLVRTHVPLQLDITVTARQCWNMARKDMVPVPKNSEPEHYAGYGDVPPWAYAAPPVIAERPEWMELQPPHNPDSKLEHGFAVAMVVPRAVFIAFLWWTHSVWWFLGISGTVGLIIMLLIAR